MEEIVIQLVTAFVGVLGIGLVFHLRLKYLLPAAFGGIVTWIVYLMISGWREDIFFPSFIASAVATLFAEIMARLYKAPATLFLIMAEVPLVPGSFLYYAMSCAVQSDWIQSKMYALRTMEYALGIAFGMFLVWALYDMFGKLLKNKVV